jgi:hypothetical protein
LTFHARCVNLLDSAMCCSDRPRPAPPRARRG